MRNTESQVWGPVGLQRSTEKPEEEHHEGQVLLQAAKRGTLDQQQLQMHVARDKESHWLQGQLQRTLRQHTARHSAPLNDYVHHVHHHQAL